MWYDPGVAAFLILSVFTLVWSALGLSWLFDTDYVCCCCSSFPFLVLSFSSIFILTLPPYLSPFFLSFLCRIECVCLQSKNDYLYGLCEGMAIAGIVNSGLWLGFCMLGLCGAVVGCMVASICSCFMSVICPCLGLHQAQHASDNLIDENGPSVCCCCRSFLPFLFF